MAWLVLALIFSGCPNDTPIQAKNMPTERPVTSRDGVLTVRLPTGLWIHRHETGLQATHPAGRYRLYFGHGSSDTLMRLAGYTKDVLGKQGWRVAGERFYAQATHLVFERGGVQGEPKEARTTWHLRVAGRLLTCDGIADAAYRERIEGGFKELCSTSRLLKLEKKPPPKKDKTQASKRGKVKPSKPGKAQPSKRDKSKATGGAGEVGKKLAEPEKKPSSSAPGKPGTGAPSKTLSPALDKKRRPLSAPASSPP